MELNLKGAKMIVLDDGELNLFTAKSGKFVSLFKEYRELIGKAIFYVYSNDDREGFTIAKDDVYKIWVDDNGFHVDITQISDFKGEFFFDLDDAIEALQGEIKRSW